MGVVWERVGVGGSGLGFGVGGLCRGRGWASLMAWCHAGPNGPGEGGLASFFLLCFVFILPFLLFISLFLFSFTYLIVYSF